MASRKKGGRRGKDRDDEHRIRKLPSVDFEDFAEADRIFRESLENLDSLPPEARSGDTPPKGKEPGRRHAAPPRERVRERLVDLHRLTLHQAKARLDAEIGEVLATLSGPVTLKIVTGKGLHSGPGGAVLPREIHRYVRSAYGDFILRIDESPADVALGGVPLRGHFSVTFGKK
jgi:DNA-nicking Smr family endonuclease